MAPSSTHSSKHAPLADSPWFWLGLFSLAALVAMVSIGPKFHHRQQRLERQSHVREQVWREGVEQDGQPLDESPTGQAASDRPYPTDVRNRLWPLAVLASAVTIGCWGWLWWQRRGAWQAAAPNRSEND